MRGQRDGSEIARGLVGAGALTESEELRQIAVGEDGMRQLEEATLRRRLLEEVAFTADAAHEAHDEVLADGIDGRVGDLRELLLEVAEQRHGPIAQHRQRDVRAHAADRLLAGRRHGRQQHAHVLARVTERTPQPRALVAIDGEERRHVGKLRELDLVLRDPLAVRLPRRDLLLDLLVGDDASLLDVDEEHLAGREAALLEDVLGWEGEHAELARHDNQSALRHHVFCGAEPVSVERRADHVAVGEDERGRSIPRLDEGRVVLVERALVLGHVRLRGPRLGHEHHHDVRQRASAGDEEVDDVVERRRVGAVGTDDRLEVGKVLREELGREERLARAHPVLVAAERVDLAVVRDAPVRVSALPGRERVRGEARVHHREPALEVVGLEVPVEVGDLLGEHEPLVDNGLRRQARDVKVVAVALRRAHLAGALPDHEERPLEGVAVTHARDEELLHHRHRRARHRTDHADVDGHVAPADHLLVVVADDLRERLHLQLALRLVTREKALRDAVVACERELLALVFEDALEVLVRDLHEDARAVAGVRVAAGRAAMRETPQDLEAHLDGAVRWAALQIDDEAEATRIMLVARVVEAHRAGKAARMRHGPVIIANT